MKNILLLLLTFFLCSDAVNAQVQVPFSRGVNLTGWFQAGSARQVQFSRYTRQDFENIKSLGCDVVRLPINLHYMTGGAPDYQLDPIFLNFLDQVVDWTEELGLHLILDNHSFDPSANTDPNVGNILKKVWPQMAAHFKDRSERVYYEVLNEPHGISDAAWNSIQKEVVTAIRAVDTKHTIIVGPAGWNSYNNLAAMPVYEDDNLIYTFHFYDPFLFTHQGASWTDPSMEPLAGIPFPYQADKMPSFPSALSGTWIQSAFNNYSFDGTLNRVKQLIDLAVAFRDARQVPVYCGEFGVYMPNSDPNERVNWYEQVRNYLEAKQIAWTMWDYHGGFGLFRAGSNGLFEHDLNVELANALGLNTPEQSPYVLQADTTGFLIYDDYIGPRIFESSYTQGALDYYNSSQPHNNSYSLYWADGTQYNSIGFDFRPDKDLSYLVANDYGLDLFIKGKGAATAFDIRFLDSKTSEAGDHPWRIRMTVDAQLLPWDGEWHYLHLPLREFTEQGSWDNDSWYNPIGAFDWSAIDRLEIVAEHGSMNGRELWFDQIWVAKEGTTASVDRPAPGLDIKVFPNPTRDLVQVQSESLGMIYAELYDAQGKRVLQDQFSGRTMIDLRQFPGGLFWFLFYNERGEVVTCRKVIRN
ncbi:MAG: cellulase family glycosylhydrolase [Saprospiraceae bacterium]